MSSETFAVYVRECAQCIHALIFVRLYVRENSQCNVFLYVIRHYWPTTDSAIRFQYDRQTEKIKN